VEREYTKERLARIRAEIREQSRAGCSHGRTDLEFNGGKCPTIYLNAAQANKQNAN